MPPRVKVTKEDIVKAAVDIVRKSGAQAINARTVASVLNCSTQPVFSNFATMDELRLAVAKKADILCQEYMQREVESGEFPTYKANGMAYIQFAKEEKEFFPNKCFGQKLCVKGDICKKIVQRSLPFGKGRCRSLRRQRG